SCQKKIKKSCSKAPPVRRQAFRSPSIMDLPQGKPKDLTFDRQTSQTALHMQPLSLVHDIPMQPSLAPSLSLSPGQMSHQPWPGQTHFFFFPRKTCRNIMLTMNGFEEIAERLSVGL